MNAFYHENVSSVKSYAIIYLLFCRLCLRQSYGIMVLIKNGHMTTINVKPHGTPGVYEPYGGCLKFMQSRDKQVILFGSANSGKTTACAVKMMLLCTLYPGCKFLFTRTSYTALIKSGVETFERVLSQNGWEIGKKPHQIRKMGDSKPTEYIFPYAKKMGLDSDGVTPRLYEGHSRIVLASLDNVKDQLGAEYDFVYLNQPEQASEEDWQYLATRANGRYDHAPYPQVFGDPNPAHLQHWIKKGGYELEAGETKDDGRWRIIKSTFRDNPVLFDLKKDKLTVKGQEQVYEMGKSLSPVVFQRMIEGEWASEEGLVYAENWDRRQHTISAERLEKEFPDWRSWDAYWALDFGFDDPFVWLEFRKHPTRELYINTKMIYMTNRTIVQHADKIKKITLGDPPPKLIVADRNPESIMILQEALGYNVISAKKGPGSIRTRINVITDMLKNHEILFFEDALVEEDNRLKYGKKPMGFIDEVELIHWRDNTKLVNDMPADGDDHAENACGYLFTHLKANDTRVTAVWI